ncbi:hypothetical protein TNCT_467351 [Trichonephila clavata]|uniref:Uncharacterized protein n=1 Tax=Trichonephila clavata TaxID=2740835 RepID=A0A8X6LLH9_TRICU|nr:hypothetical protein TNCT_467351 [Trichonephila clavata]
MKSDSAEDVVNPTPVIFQPSLIYSAKPLAYPSGNVKNQDTRFFQSPQKYNTRMLTDSPGSLAHHLSVIVFHSTQTYADMIKTRSPETESEKYSFLKSSTSASPRPTSPSFKEFMPLLEESLLNTKADSSFQSSDDSSISPKETEKERSDICYTKKILSIF